MTTIPYTSFETDTANWPKGEAVSCEYQLIKTDISVDSSDLLVRFSNLPAGVTVANPPTPIPYRTELNPFYITLYESDDDIYYRLMFEWNSLAERWDQDVTVLVRDTNGNHESLDADLSDINITETSNGAVLDGEFGITLDSVSKEYYLNIEAILNNGDIRNINNGQTVLELIDESGGVFTIVNHGSNAIINTYTKVDNNTIRIPRSMDGASPDSFARDQFNKLYVRFNR